MKNELLKIGPLTVYGYGAMIALGVIAAWVVTELRAKKHRLSSDHVFALVLWGLLGGLLCAKLLYWITEWKSIIADPGFILDTLPDGFVVYGGILGGILAGWIYCKSKKVDFWKYFDLVMPAVSMAQGFGRIGCFCAGCCYGRETHAWYGITFTHSDFAPNGVSLIPTQLISSAGDFLICGVLLWYASKKPEPGRVAAGYLVLYGVGRFLIEFLRNDYRGSLGIFSTSQIISFGIVALGIALYFVIPKMMEKKE